MKKNRLPATLLTMLTALALLASACAKETDVVIRPEEGAAAVSPSPSPTPAAPEPTPIYVTGDSFLVECEDTVNLRENSSSKSNLLGTLKNGDKVQILGYQSQRFARVLIPATSEVGYVIAGYLRAESDIFGLSTVKVTENYSYEQMCADVKALAAAYPALAKTESIGQSAQGREIPVLILGSEDAPHQVLIQGAIHAREHMTALLCTALAENWLQRGGDAAVCFHVIPMSNPDGVTLQQGREITEGIKKIYDADVESKRSEETGADYMAQWQANAGGVDLNRNFDAKWELVDTCEAPSFMNYRGTAPESEPEARALAEYTRRFAFDATLSYHATGSAIYWQFGNNDPVNDASLSLAKALAAVSAYEPLGDTGGSFGGYKDWANLKLNIPSLTIEIGTRPAPLTETEFSNVWLRCREMLSATAQWVKSR